MYKTSNIHYYLLGIFIITSIILLTYVFYTPVDCINYIDILPLTLLLLSFELYAYKRFHVVIFKKTYNYIDFSLIIALLCGIKIFLVYLILKTIIRFYLQKELQTERWIIKMFVVFFATLTAGSIVHILGKNNLQYDYFLNVNNIAYYALLVFIFNFIHSLPYVLMTSKDNRLSIKDTQDLLIRVNTDAFFVYFLYHSLLICLFFEFGLLGVLMISVLLYLTEYHIEQNHLIKIESVTDALTGVFNRGYLDRIIQKYKQDNRKFSIIMLDIDDFKKVNETYNHLVGDYILSEFTKIIRKSLRENDIIARYGGEEFVVVLENVTIENTMMISERIRKNIEKHIYNSSYKDSIYSIKHTSSLGVGVYNNKHPNNVIEEADNNLKVAKHTGKNQVYYQDEGIMKTFNEKYKEKDKK